MKHLILLLIVMIVPGIAFTQNATVKTYNIPQAIKNQKNMQLADIVEDIKYIPLETNEYCLVGESCKVLPADDYYLVRGETDPLYLFDKTGKFVRTIGRPGKGPGEYGQSFQFSYDNKKKEILILSRGVGLIYSLSGVYLRKWAKTKLIQYQVMEVCDNNTFLADIPVQIDNGAQLFRSYVFDTLSTIVPLIIDQKKIEWKPDYVQSLTSTVFLGSRILYLPPRSRTLYELINRKLQPVAIFDVGNLDMPDIYYQNLMSFEEGSKKDYISGILLTSMDENKMIIRVYYRGNPEMGILDFQKDELVFFKQKGTTSEKRGIYNDFDGGINLFPLPNRLCGEYCEAKSAVDLKELYNNGYFKNREYHYPKKNESFMKLLQNLKTDDNPVIIRYQFK